MAIFKKKKKDELIPVIAPEESESPEEIKHVEKTTDKSEAPPIAPPLTNTEYKEVPVCMSQEQINNLIIENNIMIKQIISEMD